MGYPDLLETKGMSSTKVGRGVLSYQSTDGILVQKWKDSNVVTFISSDVKVNSSIPVSRYGKNKKNK